MPGAGASTWTVKSHLHCSPVLGCLRAGVQGDRKVRPLLRVRRVERAAELGRQSLGPREVNILMLPSDVTTHREPASEPTVAYGTWDPHAFVETPNVRPQVVLVPV